jgi:hypothetical protein
MDPPDHGFSSATNAGAPDAAIFLEWTFGPDRPDANAAAIVLEEQSVAGLDSQGAPDFVGNRDLSLACDSCVLLHNRPSDSLLYHTSPYASGDEFESCESLIEQEPGNGGRQVFHRLFGFGQAQQNLDAEC